MILSAEPNYRAYAAIITIATALVLASLGITLQVVAYTLNDLYCETTLPTVSKPLFEWFALRPTSHLFHLTFAFWWLFLAIYIHSLLYYPSNLVFHRVFIARFALCCTVVATYLAVLAFMAVSPAIILLADLREPPEFMKWLPFIAGLLKYVVFTLTAFWIWRTIRFTKEPNGQLRLVNKFANRGEPCDEPKSR